MSSTAAHRLRTIATNARKRKTDDAVDKTREEKMQRLYTGELHARRLVHVVEEIYECALEELLARAARRGDMRLSLYTQEVTVRDGLVPKTHLCAATEWASTTDASEDRIEPVELSEEHHKTFEQSKAIFDTTYVYHGIAKYFLDQYGLHFAAFSTVDRTYFTFNFSDDDRRKALKMRKIK